MSGSPLWMLGYLEEKGVRICSGGHGLAEIAKEGGAATEVREEGGRRLDLCARAQRLNQCEGMQRTGRFK